MSPFSYKSICWSVILCLTAVSAGCMHSGWCRPAPACPTCETDVIEGGCRGGRMRYTVGECLADIEFGLFGWAHRKSNAIPQTLPLGSTVRSHIQVMETNGEAADFIIHQHEFVGQTPELTSDGKDHLLEVAARMRSTPFPVLIERTDNNADPELDLARRNLVAQILTDLGNPDAQRRTVVGTSYGPGYLGTRAEQTYYQHVFRGGVGGGNYGNVGNGFGGGFGGGAGGGGFAGGGFF